MDIAHYMLIQDLKMQPTEVNSTQMFSSNEKNLLLIGYISLILGCIPFYGLFVNICLLIGAFIIRANWIKTDLALNHINFIIKTLIVYLILAVVSLITYAIFIGIILGFFTWIYLIVRTIIGMIAFFNSKTTPQGWLFY